MPSVFTVRIPEFDSFLCVEVSTTTKMSLIFVKGVAPDLTCISIVTLRS